MKTRVMAAVATVALAGAALGAVIELKSIMLDQSYRVAKPDPGTFWTTNIQDAVAAIPPGGVPADKVALLPYTSPGQAMGIAQAVLAGWQAAGTYTNYPIQSNVWQLDPSGVCFSNKYSGEATFSLGNYFLASPAAGVGLPAPRWAWGDVPTNGTEIVSRITVSNSTANVSSFGLIWWSMVPGDPGGTGSWHPNWITLAAHTATTLTFSPSYDGPGTRNITIWLTDNSWLDNVTNELRVVDWQVQVHIPSTMPLVPAVLSPGLNNLNQTNLFVYLDGDSITDTHNGAGLPFGMQRWSLYFAQGSWATNRCLLLTNFAMSGGNLTGANNWFYGDGTAEPSDTSVLGSYARLQRFLPTFDAGYAGAEKWVILRLHVNPPDTTMDNDVWGATFTNYCNFAHAHSCKVAVITTSPMLNYGDQLRESRNAYVLSAFPIYDKLIDADLAWQQWPDPTSTKYLMDGTHPQPMAASLEADYVNAAFLTGSQQPYVQGPSATMRQLLRGAGGNLPFMAYEGNPLFAPDTAHRLKGFSSVLKVGTTWHMYYTGVDTLTNRSIFHATSSDGKNWTEDTAHNPVLQGTVGKPDQGGIWFPRVWKEGVAWYVLYTGTPSTSTSGAAFLATSPDGISWTKQNAGNPVMSGTTGQWDDSDVEVASIMKVGGTYYLWYNTLLVATNRQEGLATSTDLMSWSKNPSNPIFKNSRFCGDMFFYNGLYYHIVPHYTQVFPNSYGDYTEYELYSDPLPTFLQADRTFLGVVKKTAQSGWDSADLDTPFVMTDNIYRNSFNATFGEVWIYYAGCDNSTNGWNTGLLISQRGNNPWATQAPTPYGGGFSQKVPGYGPLYAGTGGSSTGAGSPFVVFGYNHAAGYFMVDTNYPAIAWQFEPMYTNAVGHRTMEAYLETLTPSGRHFRTHMCTVDMETLMPLSTIISCGTNGAIWFNINDGTGIPSEQETGKNTMWLDGMSKTLQLPNQMAIGGGGSSNAPAQGLFVSGNVAIGATQTVSKFNVYGSSYFAGTVRIDQPTNSTGTTVQGQLPVNINGVTYYVDLKR
jgi:hypothetical protein